MQDDLSIEELIIDDSFANYCFQTDEGDTMFWEEYILAFPSRKERIEEAREIVLGLRAMLKQEFDKNQSAELKVVPVTTNKWPVQKMIRYAAAIAAVFVVVLATRQMMLKKGGLQNASKENIANTATGNLLLYKTASGEKKVIVLVRYSSPPRMVRVRKEDWE